MGRGDRPEHTAPPEIFYGEDEARKYTTNSRMIAIQVCPAQRRPARHAVSSAFHACAATQQQGCRARCAVGRGPCGVCARQAALTERALELLALPDDGTPRLLLDLGCGSGLSGEALTERGHMWVVRPQAPAHVV
jgi:18S rRNA (guanine1575-N7)-methyltransferase